jgi:hypothetical protein
LSMAEGLHVPVMLLDDVVGNVGTPDPAQIVSEVPKLKVGVTFALTVTVKVTGMAQMPAAGVNVYVPEFKLLTVAGLHVPETPLMDVAGNEGTLPPEQMLREVPKLNVGVVFGLTVTANVVFVAHWPAAGVNVYVPEF